MRTDNMEELLGRPAFFLWMEHRLQARGEYDGGKAVAESDMVSITNPILERDGVDEVKPSKWN